MIARNADNVVAAEALYSLFTEYKRAGFTSEEAMQIICTSVEATIMAQAFFHHDSQ